ncbi:MAG: sarcosine oxidase subunit gamma [Pseudomonadota bacterium]
MPEFCVSSPVLQSRATSPLKNQTQLQKMTAADGSIGVKLQERFGLAICEVAAWPDTADDVKCHLPSDAQNFEFAPSRWLVISENQDVPSTLSNAIHDAGSVIDLSHGRTVMAVSGPKATWVLAKLFAIDFQNMPDQTGLATAHHGISVQIWRENETRFDVIVYRSFASSFWETLTKSSMDVGFEAVG